eukprot:2178081-Rhodomonas_salina.2
MKFVWGVQPFVASCRSSSTVTVLKNTKFTSSRLPVFAFQARAKKAKHCQWQSRSCWHLL